MRKENFISIIMSVYNTEFSLIKRAIDSVLNQDFQNFELIVIDDGCLLGNQNALNNYCIKYQNKITYLRHANCGQSESTNKGILISNGNFITFIDSDDEYKANHLSACLTEIQGYDLIASTTENIVNENDDFFVPDKYNNQNVIHIDDCILFATLFGKRKVFTNIKFEKKYAADAHFFEEASSIFKVKKVNLRTYIYYRNVANSVSALLKKKFLTNSNFS